MIIVSNISADANVFYGLSLVYELFVTFYELSPFPLHQFLTGSFFQQLCWLRDVVIISVAVVKKQFAIF